MRLNKISHYVLDCCSYAERNGLKILQVVTLSQMAERCFADNERYCNTGKRTESLHTALRDYAEQNNLIVKYDGLWPTLYHVNGEQLIGLLPSQK